MSLRRSRYLALLLLFLVFWGLTMHGKYSNSGDEPHYLMVAQSLWVDHDLDVGNNYGEDQGTIFGASGLQHELHALPARDGRLRPVHDVGVAVTLLPAYVIATTVAGVTPPNVLRRFRMSQGLFAYALVSLAVMAVVILAASATITSLNQAGGPAGVSAAIVFAVWATVPVLANAYQVFPEPFALLSTAWALHESTSPAASWTRRSWGLVGALGLLPWFHRKYVVYALSLLIVVLWRKRVAFGHLRRPTQAAAAALFSLPLVVLAAWTYHYWGNIGGPLTLGSAPFSLRAFAHGAPGLLVDRENGLFWWAPVCMVAPAAFALDRERRLWLLPIAALIIPAAAHDQWWAGFSPACRFLVPLMPIICLAVLDLLRYRSGRFAVLATLVPQIVIAAYGWQHPHDLWPRGDAHNRVLAALVDGFADRWLPSFRTPAASTWPLALSAFIAIGILNAVVVRRGRSSVH
jgi:hypothetical protein